MVGFHRSDYSYMSIMGEFDAAVPQTQTQPAPRLPTHPARPLNIVIFYPDDWRHDDLGDVKPSYVHTPFLTQLASRGIRFALNAVTTSICWISRATLYTGQYLSRHASDFLVFPRFALPTPWRSSWPYLLQRYGNYYVGHVGKWQYMHVYDGYQKYQDLFNYTRQFQEYHWDEKTGERNTFTVEKHFAEFMERRPRDRPFAITLAYYPPKAVGKDPSPGAPWKFVDDDIRRRHYNESVSIPDPYPDMSMEEAYERIPEPVRTSEIGLDNSLSRNWWKLRWSSPEHYQQGMKNYYSLITEVDQSCSRIYRAIEEAGLMNSTMFIFTSDNGLFHGAHGLAGKWWPYQESIRVPLIIQDPRMDPSRKGTVDDTSMVLNIDLASTILGAAGLDLEQVGGKLQGRDIAASYQEGGGRFVRDDWYYEFTTKHGGGPTATALVDRRYKYIFWKRIPFEQLFDLREDPLEMNDLGNSTEHRSILESMRARHEELRAEVLQPCAPDTPCDVSSGVFNHSEFIGIFHSDDTEFRYEPL